MGMGEPLANYDNTLKALDTIFHTYGFDFSHRRVTVSTAGMVPQIRRLGMENPVNLAVSLNAADDKKRSFLMPINRTYPLDELISVLKGYPLKNRKRITIEYILIAGFNDSVEDAERLTGLLRGLRCKINLIPFNEHAGVEFKRPSQECVDIFRNILLSQNFTAIVRESKGRDIGAACGQLGGKQVSSIG
jgi:23S rRNA (adenine2503-C2)-methyltransferase